jgi:sulfoxide reductase heme-binding subunit YedZ
MLSFSARVRSVCRHRWAKPILFLICLLPLAWWVRGIALDELGANPAEVLIRSSGDWTLRALCIVLTVTPLRLTAQVPELARFRRMLGLFTYFYVLLHLTFYAWFDMGFDLADISADIVKRPFIFVGFAAAVGLTLLAVTSFNAAIRWMGATRWQALHKAVYGIAVLGVVHFFWMRAGKNNFAEVSVYAAILAMLLGWRVWRYFKTRQ